MTAILFVCLGNICRSPLAEGVLRHHAAQSDQATRFEIASAGTGGWHQGEPPDHRSIQVAAHFGVDIAQQRAQKLRPEHFDDFDLILGMDRQNVKDIKAVMPDGTRAEIALYLDYALGMQKDVPDPYYGSHKDFEHVFGLCNRASEALIIKLNGSPKSY